MISASLADRICRGLLPLAESAKSLSDRLVDMGFEAHLPWQRFFESFAADEQELLEYRTYRIEQAKEALGRPWPRSMFDRFIAYFQSDVVKSLREQRDRDNGVDEEQLKDRYPRLEALWRRELTRCDRRRVQLEMQYRKEYERLHNRAEGTSCAALLPEVERWATGVCAANGSSFADPTDSYVAAMELHASRLGFSRDSAKSARVGVPIFSKPVVAEWDLCWAMEQPQVFIGSPQQNLFAPDLQLRSRRLNGSSDRVPYDRYLTLRYQLAVPEFNRAYHLFSDFATLETFIRAHLALYELSAPIIEGTIRQCMLH
jgi:hypothetical protein